MERYIKLTDADVRKKICETYEVTPAALSYALSFKRNSKKSIAMRTMAMANGGVLLEQSTNQKAIK